MAKQRGRKQGARRGLQAVLDMRELVDEGGAVLDRPILRRDRHALDPRDSHAQASARTLGLGKGAEQRGMTLFGFPARGIDLLIGRPASRIEIGEQLDVDDALLRLALDGIAKRADRKSTRLNSSHSCASRMPSSA